MNSTKKVFLSADSEFDLTACCSCGMPFLVPSKWAKQRKNDHRTFYCPNGDANYYAGETREEKLEKKLAFEKNRRIAAEAETENQRLIVLRKNQEFEKQKNRTKNGVCPCCHRTFKQLAAHMKNKHPNNAKQDLKK